MICQRLSSTVLRQSQTEDSTILSGLWQMNWHFHDCLEYHCVNIFTYLLNTNYVQSSECYIAHWLHRLRCWYVRQSKMLILHYWRLCCLTMCPGWIQDLSFLTHITHLPVTTWPVGHHCQPTNQLLTRLVLSASVTSQLQIYSRVTILHQRLGNSRQSRHLELIRDVVHVASWSGCSRSV